MRLMSVIGGVLAVCGCSAAVLGATVALPALRDNTLYESASGGLSNGAGNGMFAGRSSQSSNSIRRGLVMFDVASAVPAGSIITSATLTLHQASANEVPRTVSLHRMLASWGEGTSNATSGGGGGGAPATAGDATWVHRFFNTTAWAAAGGDFDPAPSASASVIGSGFYSWSSAGLVTDAQSFLDGGASNFGWLLRGDEAVSGTSKRFSTREEVDSSLRPVLTLEYVVPGPGMIGGAGVVILALRRRR